jgi:cytoskeletal protein CcmA (bactofilin family)
MIGRGSLILVMGFGMILGYIAWNLNEYATRAVGNMSTYHYSTQSHNLAVAGANVGLSKLYQDSSWSGSITQTMTGDQGSGSFTVSRTNVTAERALIRSVSSYNTWGSGVLHDTVEVVFDRTKKQSFSIFAWMTNFEGNVFWITGDTVWGRVHSNGALHVNGRPVFMEKVTVSKSFDPKIGNPINKAVFKQGYETGVAEIQWPNDISELVGASTSGGRSYASEIWVTLNPGTSADGDGKVYIRTSATGVAVDSISLSDASFNGALMGLGRVHISGTLDGRLSIGSMNNVIVEDDVLYEQNPLTSNSNDLLGLVANMNVVIANNTANNNNCIVQACIFARNTSFTAEDWSSRGLAGELHVLGSIVQNQRGAVGTFAGPTLTSGFSKRYRFDTRLNDPNYRPPFYPGYYTKTLAISDWWESYRIAYSK